MADDVGAIASAQNPPPRVHYSITPKEGVPSWMDTANRCVVCPELVHRCQIAITKCGIECLIGEDEGVMVGHA